ncbi:hypothetical protein H072_2268 [Dactylellina haptotyla CBS 200.50]|uniref:Cytochrome P450 n=1 Tax=Dactylellina haptotyla (strain CBS 200.50) TaxID=1284197 RepID=S8ALI7_DACHA|nr:hypothetical protein H072_2268 [Dactylellina haptotyla CBS 200.50]
MEFVTPFSQWLQSEGSFALGAAVVAAAVCTVVLYRGMGHSQDPKDPPLVPYTIPWLGSGLAFAGDFNKFMKWIRKVMPPEVPYRIYMGGRTLYFITSPRLYAKVVRISKTMSFDLLEREIFIKIFEMEKGDLENFCIGMQGMPPPSNMTQEQADEIAFAPRFMKHYHDNWYSQTEGLEFSSNKFSFEWAKHLQSIVGDKDEVTVSLRTLIEHHFFWSGTTVHFGSRLQDVAPDMAEQLWQFEEGFLKLFQDHPRWLLSGALKARDQIIVGLEKWIALAEEKAPAASLSDDLIWEEYWGSIVLRQRVKMLEDRGFSLNSKALHQFGLLWALSANTIPVVQWILIYILRNPEVLPRLREEAATAISFEPTLTIDWKTLTNLPLFLSVYREALRLTVSNMTARVVIDDTEVEGYVLKKGHMLIAPSQALHMSPVFDHPSHPVNEFWAERFMVEGLERSKLLNSWRPFAGGTTYCTGRYLAAGEIFSTVGMLLLKYDMKLEERNGPIKYSPGRTGTSAIRPDRDGSIILTKRH